MRRQQQDEPVAHDRLVVGDEDADHGVTTGSVNSTSQPPPS